MFNRTLNSTVAIGVRLEPELERRLDQLALSLGKSRSTCVLEPAAMTNLDLALRGWLELG